MSTQENMKVDEKLKEVTVQKLDSLIGRYIIHWRGEGTKGYSLQFRHMEFTNAYNATISQMKVGEKKQDFSSSYIFRYNDASPTVDESDDSYGAMQYIDMFYERDKENNKENDISHETCSTTSVLHPINRDSLIQSAKRCSLIRYVYEIVGVGDTYEDLAISVMKHRTLSDMMKNDNDIITHNNEEKSWSLRLREYGSESEKNKRYGTRKRSSMSKEREALQSMGPILLNKLVGPVNLKNPDCPLHVLEGLNFDFVENQSIGLSEERTTKCNVMVRSIASGMRTSIIAPNSRICITRTPLCPIAAFLLCNYARVKDGDCILDPFAGSCTTLLASTMMARDVKSVGVEIAPDSVVNRKNIIEDFKSRGLDSPRGLLEGDITNEKIRDKARGAIQNEGGKFDVIVTDPPYGVRERMNDSHTNSEEDKFPLIRLVECMAEDLSNGKPLLRSGGRLVAFVPTFLGENINEGLPQTDLLERASMEFVGMTEQPMSHLSRWLVVYRCTNDFVE